MAFGFRISGLSRFIDCQLLLLFVIGMITVSSSSTTSKSSAISNTNPPEEVPGSTSSVLVHNETITTFANGNASLINISTTTSPAAPAPSTIIVPVVTSGGALTVTHGRVEVQHPPSVITEVTTGSSSMTSPPVSTASPSEPTHSTTASQSESNLSTKVKTHDTTSQLDRESSTKPETPSTNEPEVSLATITSEPMVVAAASTAIPETKSTTPPATTLVLKPEVTVASHPEHHQNGTTAATEPERHSKTTTTATEAETHTTSVVSSAPSPGTISSSSDFATLQQQNHHHTNITSNGSSSSPSTTLTTMVTTSSDTPLVIDTIDVDGVEDAKLDDEVAAATTTTTAAPITQMGTNPMTGASRRRIVVDNSEHQPPTPNTTTTEKPPHVIEDNVQVIEDLPTSTVDVQTISIIEIGSGSTSRESNGGTEEEDNSHTSVSPIRKNIFVDASGGIDDAGDDTSRDMLVVSESNDVPHAQWFVLVLEGNCSLISRGRQGQGERSFKNLVLESASQWLLVPPQSDSETVVDRDDSELVVTEFHCPSPDRVRANLTVFPHPGGIGPSTNVSGRLARLEQSREPFLRYNGQDFFVYQIVTADGYLNKEPDLPPLVDIKHSNVDLVISIATGSTCAFLVLLALALLACKYWGGGGSQKPFDLVAAAHGIPAADQLTNMRLEDYTLTRIPRPRIGHVQDYYYRGLHAKRNYAPLTDDPRLDKVLTTPGGGMVSASDTSVVPLEDDSLAALRTSGLRDGVIVRPMDIRQTGSQQQHYRQLLGGSLGRLYRGARRSAGRTASSKLATVVDADGFRVRSTENLHSLESGHPLQRGVTRLPGEEEARCVVDRGVDNPNFQ